MSRATATTALRILAAGGKGSRRLTLSGGEPFLARDLVYEAIGIARVHAAASGPIECAVLTNGTLITDADIDLLAVNDVGLQVSLDGLESSQELRAPGSFQGVDRFLDRSLRRQAGWARRRLAVAVTLQAVAVPVLAQSICHLLNKGTRDIRVEPLTTHDAQWTEVTRRQLAEQVDQVADLSLKLWEETGEVPVGFLRQGESVRPGETASDPRPGARDLVCTAPLGQGFLVDPDGHAWCCTPFAASLQLLPPLGRAAASSLDLGDVRDSRFWRRLAELPRGARSQALFTNREEKWSSRGRCRDCAQAAECRVCPGSTTHIPGNRDPHRIPDNQCDFQRVTIAARRRFQEQVAAPGFLRDLQRQTHAMRRLVEALGEEMPGTSSDRAGA
jgi:sulfatase maturation enzyme AslB (radical SAM superfamily)